MNRISEFQRTGNISFLAINVPTERAIYERVLFEQSAHEYAVTRAFAENRPVSLYVNDRKFTYNFNEAA